MGICLYKATGLGITLLTKLLGVKLRTSGIERLPDAPVLFVANHFTRFETFIIPYAIYHRLGRPVHSLAAHGVFRGLFGKYLSGIGVVSVRDPLRNRKIIGQLMTGRADWVIYPEGGLVKSKRTTLKRRRMGRATRIRRPRTGAALMALRAEIFRRRYVEACRTGDRKRALHYETRYDLRGPEDLAHRAPVVVPVTVTYPRLRAGRNLLHRLGRIFARTLDAKLDEELQVEGTLLFSDASTSIHFGEPIAVTDHLDRGTDVARRLAGFFGEHRRTDLLLRRQAWRLTGAAMRKIYEGTEINFDHLFCYGLRAARRDVFSAKTFHHALYLAAMKLRGNAAVRLHPALHNGIVALTTGAPFEPLESIERLAREEGVLYRENGTYVINRGALLQTHDRNEIRLRKMVQVIANELEPIESVVETVRDAVNLDDAGLAARLPRTVLESDRAVFHREYDAWHEPDVSKHPSYGEPFLLEAPKARGGIVLVHGYLACPEQMRPMADHLHANGYTVYGARLDGHGTAPCHLSEVTLHQWRTAVAEAYSALCHSCERTYIAGFSLGGLLALLLAADLGEELDGLIAINTPLKLRNRKSALVPAVVGANSLIRRLRPGRRHFRRTNISESPDLNYETDYLRGVRELRRTMTRCRRALPKVTAPTLIISADQDPVVHSAGSVRLLEKLGSSVREHETIEAARHVIVRGEYSGVVCEVVEDFLGRLAK